MSPPLGIDGDIIGSTEPTTMTLQVRSPLWIYVGPNTQPLASLEMATSLVPARLARS